MLSARRRASTILTNAARVSFAALLISSASMWQWLDVERRTPPVYAGYTDFYVYASDLFLALTVAFGFLAFVASKKRIGRGPWYLTVPLAALVALSFLSALPGVDSALTIYHSLRLLLFFALYLVLVNLDLPAHWTAIPLALGVLIQGGVGLLQFSKQSSLGLYALGELDLDPARTGVSILRYDDVRILRAYGLTDHPNLLGGFLAFALIFVLGYYFVLAKRSSQKNLSARYVLLVPLAVGVIALFYTFSRAAQLAFGMGVVMMFAAWLREPAQRSYHFREVAIVSVVIAGSLLLPAFNNQRLIGQRVGQGDSFSENVGEARSLTERDVLTDSANRIFYQHQLLGVGTGVLPLAMYRLDREFPSDQYNYQPAHLVLLVAAAELGLLGGFLWAWLMLAPLIVMWLRRAQWIENPWAAAVAASVIALLVVSFFDYYPWLWQAGRIWQWSAWGLFAVSFSSAERNFS